MARFSIWNDLDQRSVPVGDAVDGGLENGLENGLSDGLEDGLSDGLEDGLSDGLASAEPDGVGVCRTGAEVLDGCGDTVAGDVGCGLLPPTTLPMVVPEPGLCQMIESSGFPATFSITVMPPITAANIAAAVKQSISQPGRRRPFAARALPLCPPLRWLGAGVASAAVSGPPSHQARPCPDVRLASAASRPCPPAGWSLAPASGPEPAAAPRMFARRRTTGAAVRSFSPVRER